MMKSAILLILSFSIYAMTLAQDSKKIEYQFNFGTNLSFPYTKSIDIWPEFEGNPHTDYRPGFGYYFEFLTSYNLNTDYAITSGLNYNYNSLVISDEIGFYMNKGKITNSYLSIPVLFNYKPSAAIPLTLSAGPYFSSHLYAREKGTTYIDTAAIRWPGYDPVIESLDIEQDYNNDITRNFRPVDYGFSVQFQYEFKLQDKLTATILSRFNCGLPNVISLEMPMHNNATKWKNYNMMLGCGIKF
jgi:hypothetical protein